MKSVKIAAISLVSLLALTGVSRAQFDCGNVGYDTLFPSGDTVMIVETRGQPGATVQVPVSISNDWNVTAFQLYMEFDASIIHPFVLGAPDTIIDSVPNVRNCRDTVINAPETTLVCDTLVPPWLVDTFITTYYQFNPLTDRWDTTYTSGRVALSDVDFLHPNPNFERMVIVAYPDYVTPRTVIDTATSPGGIFTIPFAIDSNALHGTRATINFYWATVKVWDSVLLDSVPVGCQYSQYSDTMGNAWRFWTSSGDVVVDTAAVTILPNILYFTASDSTINEGESTTLNWSVSNATSVEISNIGLVGLTGSQLVSPTITTTYNLRADNDSGFTIQGITITVIPIGGNFPPVFTQPTQTSYTIDQGQTLAFQVSATDADGDTISLSPVSLPNNATFGPTNPVIGIGTVTADFSFTPDFSQMGAFQVTFTADDGKAGGATQLTVTINVNELQYDRLFTTSAEGQSPVGGLAGTRSILLPINLVTSQTVYGVQFDFFYDAIYFEIDSIITTPRTQDYVIYENIGAIPGEIRVVTFGVANEPIVTDTASTAILYVVMTIDTSASPGDYPVLIEDGWESINPDPNFPSLPLVTDSGIIQVDRLGDVNLDKRVDVADAVNVVGNILGNYTFTPRQFATADVVADLTINVLDLVGIINLIFGIPLSPVAGQYVGGEWATVSLDYSDLTIGAADIMIVRSELPEQIAGVQLEIRYDPSAVSLGKPTLGDDATRMVLSSKDNKHGKLTVLLYFKNPFRTEDLIQVGEADLIRIPMVALKDIEVDNESQMKLTRALLSTASAGAVRVEGMDLPLPSTFDLHQNYPNPFNPTTTIEFSLGGAGDGSATQHVTLDIYNILGQHVKTLLDEDVIPGNYQVEWDASNSSGRRVASGIYLYKLQVDQESKSKKMLFLK